MTNYTHVSDQFKSNIQTLLEKIPSQTWNAWHDVSFNARSSERSKSGPLISFPRNNNPHEIHAFLDRYLYHLLTEKKDRSSLRGSFTFFLLKHIAAAEQTKANALCFPQDIGMFVQNSLAFHAEQTKKNSRDPVRHEIKTRPRGALEKNL